MPSTLKFGAIACFLVLATCSWLLSMTGLWPSWSSLTGKSPADATLAAAQPVLRPPVLAPPNSEPRPGGPPASVPPASAPSLLVPQAGEPRSRTAALLPPSVIRAVAFPPVPTPLVMIPFAALPAIVTPASGGGVVMTIPAPPPPPVPLPRMPATPIPAVLTLPAGSGPFPAVILLHGCDGQFRTVPDWALRLNTWGYAVLMPDSMTPRGVKTVCEAADQPKVTGWDRMGDVGAAATWLRTRPEIDPARIAVLGLSHGGATAALAALSPYAGIRLRAAVDYYGPCGNPQLHGSVPLLVLAGEADDWGDPAARCRSYGQKLRPDQPFEIHTYPGVFHAFDHGSVTKTLVAGHALAFDSAAAEDSFVRVRSFLDRNVRF